MRRVVEELLASGDERVWELAKPLVEALGGGEGMGAQEGMEGGEEREGRGWDEMWRDVKEWEAEMEGRVRSGKEDTAEGQGMGESGVGAGGVRAVSRCGRWTACPLGRLPGETGRLWAAVGVVEVGEEDTGEEGAERAVVEVAEGTGMEVEDEVASAAGESIPAVVAFDRLKALQAAIVAM